MADIVMPVDPVQQGPAITRTWVSWFSQVTDLVNAMRSSGTTAQRPTKGLYVGRYFFDTTVGLPIWYDGSGWIDAAGNPV